MFTNSPIYGQVHRQGQRLGVGWAVMVPGLLLTLFAVAILVWPHLLAYLVATVLLFVGLLLTIWGGSIHRAERQRSIQHTIRYDVF
jgi:hypothetical protein